MIDIYFDKLYRYDRIAEPCYIGIPVRQGELWDADNVCVWQGEKQLPLQARVTSRHRDGSVRFLFLRFLADLPGNKSVVLQCDLHGAAGEGQSAQTEPYTRMKHCAGGIWPEGISPVEVHADKEGITVSTLCGGEDRGFSFRVKHDSPGIFEQVGAAGRVYGRQQFTGPLLKDGEGRKYRMRIGSWQVVEQGPICAILKASGSNVPQEDEEESRIDFELKLTAWAGKPWVEVSYRIVNTTAQPLHVASLVFQLLRTGDGIPAEEIAPMVIVENPKVMGEGDPAGQSGCVFHARGTGELRDVAGLTPVENVRTCAGSSNFKTDFYLGQGGAAVNRVVDSKWLLYESNEHISEVFYGTFFADCTDAEGGVCATVFQAQQNYPKAVSADRNGLSVMLVPENVEKVVMQVGMSREQRFLLHFHDAQESLAEIDNRSLIYQMPDRPYLSPETHRASGVWQIGRAHV